MNIRSIRTATMAVAVVVCTFSVRANVLVYEGFHPADYNNVSASGNVTASDPTPTGTNTIGVSTAKWNAMGGSQIKVFGSNYGLNLPAEMTAANFSAIGGSIGLNPGSANKAHRAMSHSLAANALKFSSGTLYFRMLLNLDSNAAAQLDAGESLSQKDGGYFGFGFGKVPSSSNYYSPTSLQAGLSFVIWKNSSSQYVLSFVHTTASGTTFTSYPIITGITLGTTYVCYAEVQVGAGTDGKEIIRAGAMAAHDYNMVTPWAALGGGSDSVEVELITDSDYPTCMAVAGPYGTKPGYFRADEIVVGTKLSDVLAFASGPVLGDVALTRTGSATYSLTAKEIANVADVFMIADDGAFAATNLIQSGVTAGTTVTATISDLAVDRTCRISVFATNSLGTACEVAGDLYTGALSLGATTDANENGLVAGGVTVSRATADPWPLEVAYTISGSAGAAGTTWVAPVAVTIPANASSAILPVVPLLDRSVDADVTITLALAAGNYEPPAASATLTLRNKANRKKTDYARKMTLTPSATALAKIGETSWADFPVLVRLPAEASAFLRSADGTDLFFEDESGTLLPFEVETFDASGTTFVWVKVPSLSSATQLTVYFGGPSNGDVEPEDVWTRYVGVWHFDSDAAGTTTVADATGHALNGTTTGTLTTYAGPFGNAALQSTVKINAPDYDSRLSNVAQFSVSGWFKAPNYAGGTSKYHSFASKKDDLDWNADKGWYLEMSQSKTTANLVLTGSNNFTIPDVSANWNYFHLVSNGSTLKVYMNGSTSASLSKNYVVKASEKVFTICGTGGCSDEYRLRAGEASAAETALEYATMADASFFDAGEIGYVDESTQVFQTPTVIRNADGTYTVTVVLAQNNGLVGVIYDAGASAITNVISASATPGTYTDTPANLSADTTYAFAAYGRNANGTEVVEEGGVFYNGELSITKISDADENDLSSGVFRISRADTAHDLVVGITVGGTATPDQTYVALPATITIPAGSTYVDVTVEPLNDGATTEDTTVTVTLDAGLYGVSQGAGSASLTIFDLVTPAGFNTWMSPTNGLASVGSNWSEGHAPTASEHVLFDGRFSTADCTWDADASATVAGWTQTNGYTGIITLNTVYPGKGDFECLTVRGPMAIMSGTITHPQSWTQWQSAANYLQDLIDNETYRIRIDAASLTVGASGRIDARNKGYYHANSGNHTSPVPSHGGRLSATGQAPYDDPREPIHIGMAYKRASGTYTIGIGGGAIYLTSDGDIVVDGYVGADTGADTWNRGYTLRGAAAAGSVYVRGVSVSGTGTISASALATAEQNNRGVGGRVAVIATSQTPIDYTNLTLKASVYPYNNNGGISSTLGSCGTVFVMDGTMTNGVLIVRNFDQTSNDAVRGRRTDITTDATWAFDRIELGGNVQLGVPAGTTLTLPGWDSITAPYNASATPSGLYYCGGTLAFGSASDVTLSGHWYFAPVSNYVFNANVSLADGAAIGFGGKYTQQLANNAYPSALDTIHCTVNGDLTVPAGCAVNVVKAGAMQDSNYIPAGYPMGVHGGRRSNTGMTIGSVFRPRTLPHGQSNSYGHIIPGGAVELVVTGTFTLGGTIAATSYDGNDGINSQVGGGSIDLTAGRLVGDGAIKAGAVKNGQPGGRIAIRLTGSGATLDDFSGTVNCSTMGSGSIGSCGSIYVQNAGVPEGRGTVVLDDNNVTCTTYTPICATGYQADNTADFKYADLVVRNEAKAQVTAADENGDFRMDEIDIGETGELDLFGHAFTVTTASVGGRKVKTGTYTAAQLQELGFDGVVDTADGAGGQLIVRGATTVLMLQ